MQSKSFDQFVCLAGMPRAGSTVLAAILSQNPAIHTEGNSPMCQLMWDTYLSYQDRCSREFASNGKNDMLPKIIGQIPHVYYSDAFEQDVSGKDLSNNLPELPANIPTNSYVVFRNIIRDPTEQSSSGSFLNKTRIVVDRCRSWTNECNLNMLRSSVDPQIKVIVMDRPLQDVMESYARLFSANHMGSALDQVLPQLLGPGTEPVMRAWELVRWAKAVSQEVNTGVDASGVDISGGKIQDISGNKVESNTNPYKDMFCFVTYDELLDSPTETLARIYEHCGWEPFTHDFDHIVMKNPEDEKVHGLVGQYTVREKLARTICEDNILPDSVLEKIWEIEGKMQITV